MSNDPNQQTPRAFISQLINYGFARHRPMSNFPEFEAHELDLTQLKLNVSFFVPFIIPKKFVYGENVTLSQIKHLWDQVEEHLSQRQKKITVILISGCVDIAGDDHGLAELEEKGMVIWDQALVQEISKAGEQSIRHKLISQRLVSVMGRASLSPYVSGRPAVGGRFFGRSNKLHEILQEDSNCTILGNRRIGKSSLLKEIRERLKLRGYRTAEVYGATCHSTDDFVVKLLNELGEFRRARQVVKSPYNVTSLPRWIKQMAANEPVAVFVDELDHILEFDAQQGYTLIHMLREIFESNTQCRIFFAGFRRVMSEAKNLGSPLFNFTKPIGLLGFNREETFEMVTKPLSHMGVEVKNTNLPQEIYLMTAGQPEHIQICCAELIRIYEETEEIPRPNTLINQVRESSEYKQKVVGAFVSNTNPYEELVCYLLIKAAGTQDLSGYEFNNSHIGKILTEYGNKVRYDAKTVSVIITNLSLSGIIVHTQGTNNYRFSSPMMATYVFELDIDKGIQDALKKIKENPDLYFTPPYDEEIHQSQG